MQESNQIEVLAAARRGKIQEAMMQCKRAQKPSAPSSLSGQKLDHRWPGACRWTLPNRHIDLARCNRPTHSLLEHA